MPINSNSDLERLRNLRERIAEISRGDTGYGVGAADMTQRVLTDFHEKARSIERAWPDDRLLAEYQRTNGESGDAGVEDLLAEIRHRNLDI